MTHVFKKLSDKFVAHKNIKLTGLEKSSKKIEGKLFNFPLYQEHTADNYELENFQVNPQSSFAGFGTQLDFVIPKHIDIINKLYAVVVLSESGAVNTVTPNPIHFIVEKLEIFLGDQRKPFIKYDDQMFLEEMLFTSQAELETRMADLQLDATNNDFTIGASIAASSSATYYLDLTNILNEQHICVFAINQDIRLRVTFCASASKMTNAGSGTLAFTSFTLQGIQKKLCDVEKNFFKDMYKTGYNIRFLDTIRQTKTISATSGSTDQHSLNSIDNIVPFMIVSDRAANPSGSTLYTRLTQSNVYLTDQSGQNLHGGINLTSEQLRSGFLYKDFIKSKYLLNVDGVYPIQFCTDVQKARQGVFVGGMHLDKPQVNQTGDATETVFVEVYVYFYEYLTIKDNKIVS